MDFLQEGLERLWAGQVELKRAQAEIKDQLQKNQATVTMDDIVDKVHEEVLRIYFDIVKVEQGQGKNLKDKFIAKVEESWKSILLESVRKYIQANFVPGVHSFNCWFHLHCG